MPKNYLYTLSGQDTSMNFWARKIREFIDKDDPFANALIIEESNKTARLKRMSDIIGLPVYETFQFILPEDITNFTNLCIKKVSDGWKLNLRLMDLKEETLIFRHLDIDVNDAISIIESLSHFKGLKASISPYKIPSISGTILLRKSDVVLEVVFGPHYWLTKWPPQGVPIFRCWYYFPYISAEYSTDDANIRITLFRILEDIIKMVFDLKLNQLSEIEKSLYAEFHWNESLGYKFLECSFADVWTGINNKKSC